MCAPIDIVVVFELTFQYIIKEVRGVRVGGGGNPLTWAK